MIHPSALRVKLPRKYPTPAPDRAENGAHEATEANLPAIDRWQCADRASQLGNIRADIYFSLFELCMA